MSTCVLSVTVSRGFSVVTVMLNDSVSSAIPSSIAASVTHASEYCAGMLTTESFMILKSSSSENNQVRNNNVKAYTYTGIKTSNNY